jgi:hypothetical protein
MGHNCSKHPGLIKEDKMQQVKFTIETKYGPYTDCIVYPDDQIWTDEEIEAEKLKRVTEWFRHCFSEEFPGNTA